ncbi:tRNA pseudouridine synthase A [Adhaeretor mobilis]|uniref:tRNA pseudouridine synthase A n=1 Tax=Adhaeretor mobilis TaxID=1930276 RepID=A0A517N091_9BACT|nr:tRNA pseudouridine synthase A [Adhaeretor mobilis]
MVQNIVAGSTWKITLAYDGADFCGWQSQPERRTVQGAFEQAWLDITGESVRVNASGRTDSGVHAMGQVVGVQTESELPAERLLGGLNAKLPDDATVVSVEAAPEGFHAQHQAKSKRYRYAIHNDRRPSVALRRNAWHVPQQLDIEAMKRAGQALLGKQDFASLESVGSPRESTVRTIFSVEVIAARDEGDRNSAATPETIPLPLPPYELNSLILIDVVGDGFLYNMVRTIAGSLVHVGAGRKPVEWMGEMLLAKDRKRAGQTAPAHGLTLVEVGY